MKKFEHFFSKTKVEQDKLIDAFDLIKKLLIFNPELRLTAKEALNHPFLMRFTEFDEPNEDKCKTRIKSKVIDDNKKEKAEVYRETLYRI